MWNDSVLRVLLIYSFISCSVRLCKMYSINTVLLSTPYIRRCNETRNLRKLALCSLPARLLMFSSCCQKGGKACQSLRIFWLYLEKERGYNLQEARRVFSFTSWTMLAILFFSIFLLVLVCHLAWHCRHLHFSSPWSAAIPIQEVHEYTCQRAIPAQIA